MVYACGSRSHTCPPPRLPLHIPCSSPVRTTVNTITTVDSTNIVLISVGIFTGHDSHLQPILNQQVIPSPSVRTTTKADNDTREHNRDVAHGDLQSTVVFSPATIGVGYRRVSCIPRPSGVLLAWGHREDTWRYQQL